jgi:PAS domain S-box-containing protein
VSYNESRQVFLTALKIVAIYLVISLFWIFFSDSFVYVFFQDPEVRRNLSIVKGGMFVLVTSLLLFVLIYRDLFAYFKLKEELLKSKKRWEEALVNARDGMWDWNIKTGEAFYSAQWKEMLGYEENEINDFYDEWEKRVHPKDLKRVKELLGKHLNGLLPAFYCEYRMMTKEGRFKWIYTRGRVIENDENGSPKRMVGVNTDFTEQKEISEALKNNEERFRIISENSGNIVWVYDIKNKNFEFISPAIYQFIGQIYEDESVREKKEFIISVSVKTIIRIIEEKLKLFEADGQNQKSIFEEIVHRLSNGTTVHLEIQLTFVPDEDGKILEVLGVTRDVTEKKEIEEKILESEEKYRSVFENSGVAILITKPEGDIISANHEAEKLFNMSSSEICNSGRGCIVEEESEEFQAYLEERSNFNKACAELTLFRKGGETFRGKVSTVIYRDRDGQTLGCVVINDLTEQKRAEEILKKSEEQYRNIFEYSPIAAVFWDSETKIIFWNKASEKVFGWTKEEVIGRKLPEFFIPENSLAYTQSQLENLVNSIPREIVINYNYRKDGSVILCEWNNTIITDKNGRTETVISLGKDITEQKRLEAELVNSREELETLNEQLEHRVDERTNMLEAANKELEAFSYSVSHDLRAPLRAIDGFSRIIFEDYNAKLDENGVRILTVIRNNVKKMGQLIDDLLSFSRLGRKTVNVAEVDMKSVFQTICGEQASFYREKQVEFIIADMPNAFADISLIKHVVSNLVSNALKFSSKKERPRIEIAGYVSNNTVVYYVKDNGAGFNMKYASKLFGVFQRLHSEEEFNGTGVGLAIVQRIIHKHNGIVWAEGKIGEGAKFFFSLPLKPENVQHETINREEL